MFERLTDRLSDVFKTLAGRGILTEANISDAMRDVRRALLEADVSYPVAKEFVATVRKACLGEKVLKSIAPGQQAIKVVQDELERLLGESNVPLDLDGKPSVIMLVGLHGSGKTTTASKLALHIRDKLGHKPMLVAGDLYRPAAIDQLTILGQELDIPVYSDREAKDVARIAVAGRNKALDDGCDVVIVDTAGRLQIDTGLVKELVDIKRRVQPREILLVADAALGQEAVSVAEHFDEALGITGIVLTKLDGDARGGAALSMRQVTGRPIKFVGLGERATDFDAFHPDRMASRILGMGDVVGLVERASEQIEEDEAREMEEKFLRNSFGFDDFLTQLGRIRKMGGIMSLLDMLPGMGKLKGQLNVDERQFSRIEGIICSMTPDERRRPESLDQSRRRRIARGSGVDLMAVNQLVRQFEDMRKMMSRMGKMMGGGGTGMPSMDPGAAGAALPGSGFGFGGGGRGPRSAKAKKDKRKKNKRRR